jgi:membrane protease YdiL (CAAX protease family)
MAVEIFFRGFLVLAVGRFLGKDAILPMAATYAALHFGKPLGETISSIFGGYILGVVCFRSATIYGGIFLHAGIALMMELYAFWQQ